MKVKKLFKKNEVYATLGTNYYYTTNISTNYIPTYTQEEFHRNYINGYRTVANTIYRQWWEDDETTNQAQTTNENS